MGDAVIRDVECVSHAPGRRGGCEVILIGAVDHFGFQGRQEVYVPGPQAKDERSTHGILVEI